LQGAFQGGLDATAPPTFTSRLRAYISLRRSHSQFIERLGDSQNTAREVEVFEAKGGMQSSGVRNETHLASDSRYVRCVSS
jgi:hypothetical protein